MQTRLSTGDYASSPALRLVFRSAPSLYKAKIIMRIGQPGCTLCAPEPALRCVDSRRDGTRYPSGMALLIISDKGYALGGHGVPHASHKPLRIPHEPFCQCLIYYEL